MHGTIFFENLIISCLIGAHVRERRRAQKVRLDVACIVDVGRAIASDDLTDTVDYHALYDAIRELARTRTFRLLERFAGAVADAALADPRVMSVTLRAAKPYKLPQCAAVGVELTKLRGEP